MRVLVLGGAGMMAEAIVRDLIESEPVDEVVLGDLDVLGMREVVRRFASEKLKALKLDITASSFPTRVSKAKPDVLVNSAWYEYNIRAMRTAIQRGFPYLDLGGLYHTTLKQLKLDGVARKKNVTCVLGMGSSPGTMNVMGRFASERLDSIERMVMRCGDRFLERAQFAMPYSVKTVIDEFTKPPVVLRNGKTAETEPLTGHEEFELPAPVGKVSGYYTLHSELATMPRSIGKGVKEMDFIVAYDPTFTSTITALVKMGFAALTPIRISKTKIVPYNLLVAMLRRLPKLDRDPVDAEVLRVEAYGTKEGEERWVQVDCVCDYHKRWGLSAGTVDTGVPASIVAQWLAQGRVERTGVFAPEDAIPVEPYFEELGARDRGIRIYESLDGGSPRLLSGG